MAAWHLFLKESCLSYWKGTLNQPVQQFYNSKHEISRNQQNCWLQLGLFGNIKHQGTKAILKGFLAWKKRNTFFLNLSQICQNNFHLGGYSTSTSLSWLRKCHFVKQSCPIIGVKSTFLITVSFNSLIFNK